MIGHVAEEIIRVTSVSRDLLLEVFVIERNNAAPQQEGEHGILKRRIKAAEVFTAGQAKKGQLRTQLLDRRAGGHSGSERRRKQGLRIGFVG